MKGARSTKGRGMNAVMLLYVTMYGGSMTVIVYNNL